MLKKIIITTSCIIGTLVLMPAYASDNTSCKVQVAVSSDQVRFDENVAFNVTNQNGFGKSITLYVGSGPQYIEGIPCSPDPLTISATRYSVTMNKMLQGPIGQCVLKAGDVVLNQPDNSVSVVFPQDFKCSY